MALAILAGVWALTQLSACVKAERVAESFAV
jgi:hypothetical protein